MLEEYINQIKPYIIELFSSDSSGHDISHLERTMNIALKICDGENGDKLVVGIAAYIHDIHRLMEKKEGRFVSPKDSIPVVMDILNKTDLSDEIKNKICFAIENHELYNWNGKNVDDINTLILQDADNLDAIGAIGIGRSFMYAGGVGMLAYTSEYPLEDSKKFVEGDKDPSVLHHYYHKLFKLADNMNTETAKKIANERTKYMKEFVNEFLDEWNGIK